MLKLGIMGSTRGTDLQAIINGINNGSIDAQVNIVISNNKEAYILERAELNKLPFKFISDQEISREEFGNRATKVLKDNGVDFILLIGFMKILSTKFCREWSDKILNVHPSLLPKYAGGMNNKVHQQVLESGDLETGCTIHFVTEEVDQGPILIQKRCKVESSDTLNSLKERVQILEGEAFIEAINLLDKGSSA